MPSSLMPHTPHAPLLFVESEVDMESNRRDNVQRYGRPKFRLCALPRSICRAICALPRSLCCAMCDFWSVTTDPTYQRSMASRRPLWSRWFLITAIGTFVFDVVGLKFAFLNQGIEISSLLKPAAFAFSALMPYDCIWSDAFIMTSQALAFWLPILWSNTSVPFCDPSILADAITTHQTFSLILSALVGIHSYAAAIYVFIACCLQYIRWPQWQSLISCSVVVNYASFIALIAYIEISIAKLCRNLRNEHQVNEFLLDNATDGFCNVDCCNGNILSASSQLANTVGSKNLVGQQFSELFNSQDRKTIIGLLDVAAKGQHEMAPVLVSCSQISSQPETITFDAKLLSYTVSRGVIRVLFQVQGELRVQSSTKKTFRIDESEEGPVDDKSVCSEMPHQTRAATFENMSMCSLDLSVTDYGPNVEFPNSRSNTAEAGIQVNAERSSQSVSNKYIQTDGADLFRKPPKFPLSPSNTPRAFGSTRGRSLERSRVEAARPSAIGTHTTTGDASHSSPNIAANDGNALNVASGRRRLRLTHVLPPA